MHPLFCRFKFFWTRSGIHRQHFAYPGLMVFGRFGTGLPVVFGPVQKMQRENEMDGDLLQKGRLGAIIGRI